MTMSKIQGFTLIELLVYTAILALVLVLAVQFALGVFEAAVKSAAKEEVQVNAANIIQAFDFEVRHAEKIYTPTSDFIGAIGQLSLLTTRDLPPGETVSYVDIYEDRGRFCIKREIAGVSCITSQGVVVSGLAFTKITQQGGAESVRMRFTLRNNIPKAEYQFSQTMQTSARLRSY